MLGMKDRKATGHGPIAKGPGGSWRGDSKTPKVYLGAPTSSIVCPWSHNQFVVCCYPEQLRRIGSKVNASCRAWLRRQGQTAPRRHRPREGPMSGVADGGGDVGQDDR